MPNTITIIELVGALVGVLLVAAFVLALCKRIKMPFTVALVLVGLVIANAGVYLPSHLHGYFQYHISPDLILYVCLPTLLFESAFALDPRQLQRNIIPILTLAIPGLLLSTGLIGLIVYALTPIGLAPALLLGAILSATDPIAVIALFKSLGAPKRLTVLVEGESLFNDATSIVTAKLLFTVVMAGAVSSHDITHGIFDFFLEFFGGIVVGWVIAVVIGFILGLVESDPEIEISLTTILAYATFMIAQNLVHVSGVMATVAAGLTLGGWGRAKISPSVHSYLKHFWEFLAYTANALIFLLVGMSVNITALVESLGILLVVILAMIVSRAVITFNLIPIINKISGSVPIDLRYQTALFWGGLRGAIALAIVLSLNNFAEKELFIALVMGAVLFTLLFHGLTMEALVKKLGLNQPPLPDRLAREEGQLSASKRALKEIPQLQQGGLFSARISRELQERCEQRIKEIERKIAQLREQEMDTVAEEKLLFVRALAAEKNIYFQMFAKGHLTETAYRSLNDTVVNQLDLLRYSKDSHAIYNYVKQRSKSKQSLINLLEKLPLLGHIADDMRARQIVRDYEELWGQYQGYVAILNHIDQQIADQPDKLQIAQKVRDLFARWQDQTRTELDAITEQFPEFVNGMQERLANRLVLQSEVDALSSQVRAGTLPEEVANNMQHDIEQQIYKLREKGATKVELDPNELLRKVPFFKDIPEQDFKHILALLHAKIVSKGEAILQEGGRGQCMYLIMRGVVRVSKKINGEDKDLATLFAGDFFGEIALLHDYPRNATCVAVTPCSLFELSRNNFNTVKNKYPSIAAAIEKVDIERQTFNNKQKESD